MREFGQMFGESACCAHYPDTQTSQNNSNTTYAKIKSTCVTNYTDTDANWKYDKLQLADAF